MHVVAVVPLKPVIHVHAASAELTAGDVRFGAHAVHDSAAPAAQEPAAQSLHSALPVLFVYLPPSHAMQSKAYVEPLAAEYVPVAHSMHNSISPPPIFLYVPGRHAVHGPNGAP